MAMPHELLRDVLVTRISTAVVASSSAINMTIIDMKGYEGVSFIAGYTGSPSSAGTYFKAQGGTSSGGGDMADLSSSASFVSTGQDSGVSLINIFRPAQRYVRMVGIAASTYVAVDAAFALQYRAVAVAVTQSTTVYNTTFLVRPATGGAT